MQSPDRGGNQWRTGCCTAPSLQQNYLTLSWGGSFSRLRTNASAPLAGAAHERLHELIGCVEKERPAARVDIARIVARLEVVLAARVRVGRFRVQQVPDAERELQILVDQPGVRTVEMEDAVRADVLMLLRAGESWTCGVEILECPRNIRIVALVLLRESEVPRREFPVQVQIVPPPRDHPAVPIDDRGHHPVDAAERAVHVLNVVF